MEKVKTSKEIDETIALLIRSAVLFREFPDKTPLCIVRKAIADLESFQAGQKPAPAKGFERWLGRWLHYVLKLE